MSWTIALALFVVVVALPVAIIVKAVRDRRELRRTIADSEAMTKLATRAFEIWLRERKGEKRCGGS